MKYYLIFLISFFVCACNFKSEEKIEKGIAKDGRRYQIKTFGKDTSYKEVTFFYPNDTVAEISHLKNGIKDGDETKYFSNGIIKLKGSWVNGQRLGWFKVYTNNGVLDRTVNYIFVSDSTRPNQYLRFSPNGDTINSESFYYVLYHTADTIKNGQNFSFKVVLAGHVFDHAYVRLCNFDEKYDVIPNGVCDTFQMNNFELARSPKKYNLGENFVRGEIVNYGLCTDSISKQKYYNEARLYFDDVFYVKP